MKPRPLFAVAGALALATASLTACAPAANEADTGKLQVLTTTGILADLARNVAGQRASVRSLVPEGGDPHSYEPTLRNVRSIAYADVVFTNYLLLEEHNLIRTIDANIRPGTPNIALAENATKYAAEIIPLVENVSLDTIWLGLRVAGKGQQRGATRRSTVDLQATAATGPGIMATYLTETFGRPHVYFNSGDGFDSSTGYRDDTATLPLDAHTHASWSFGKPGVYTVDFRAQLRQQDGARPSPLGSAKVTFAVGINPRTIPGMENATVLEAGHADVTVNADSGRIEILHNSEGTGSAQAKYYDPSTTVISVPTKALADIPADPAFRFLGKPGTQTYLLPQAVLGKHVHGEIDPHLWHDVHNAQAYVQSIRDTLAASDPQGAPEYHRNAEAYLEKLRALDAQLEKIYGQIPVANRQLVTSHDAYAYLAHAYGLKIAGYISQNPGVEPSVSDRVRLNQTIRDLGVKAVFLEPNLATRSSELTVIAKENNVRVCAILGDSFTREISTYTDMMLANAREIRKCLS